MKQNYQKSIVTKVLSCFLAIALVFVAFPIHAHAAKSVYYDSKNLYKISRDDLNVVRNTLFRPGPEPVLVNKTVYYKFSYGNRVVYIDLNALLKASNPTNENAASRAIQNGLAGGTAECSYIRMTQERGKSGKINTSFYDITVSSSTAGSRHTVMVDLNGGLSISIDPSKIYLDQTLRQYFDSKNLKMGKMRSFGWNPYIAAGQKKILRGLIGFGSAKSIVPTVEVTSSSNKTYRLPNGKYAHKGNFSSVYYKAKGFLPGKDTVKLSDFIKVAIETAATAKSLASCVTTGNYIGLASLGLSTVQKLKPKSQAHQTYETKEQFLSNTDKNKLCYKVKFESPVHMNAPGDYMQAIFYTNKNASKYTANLKLNFK